MMQIGKSVKYDECGRVTLPATLAKLLELEKGKSEVKWSIDGGQIILEKVTRIYMGDVDCEGEEIKGRVYDFEQQNCPGSLIDEELSEEERKRIAWEQYKEDKAAKSALKESVKRT